MRSKIVRNITLENTKHRSGKTMLDWTWIGHKYFLFIVDVLVLGQTSRLFYFFVGYVFHGRNNSAVSMLVTVCPDYCWLPPPWIEWLSWFVPYISFHPTRSPNAWRKVPSSWCEEMRYINHRAQCGVQKRAREPATQRATWQKHVVKERNIWSQNSGDRWRKRERTSSLNGADLHYLEHNHHHKK